MNSLWLAFLTGLTTGGLSCIAVQGGLISSAVAQTEQEQLAMKRWHVVALFLLAKVVAYTILGFFLGLLGASLTLSPKMFGAVQIIVGLFLLATAARIADIHPIFRYVVIQPPKWAYKLMKRTSNTSGWFAPILLGVLTVFIPCGVTQAMMVTAIATGNPWMGAALMGAFVVGTSPIFFALGLTIIELLQKKLFAYGAAVIVAIFGIVSINGGIGLTGSIWTLQNIYKAAVTPIDKLASNGGQVAGVNSEGKQDVTIQVASSGYTSSARTLKAGVPVRLTLQTNNTQGCSRAFTIPDLNISKVLSETGEEIVEFTPRKTGTLAFACSMGMFTGRFDVIP